MNWFRKKDTQDERKVNHPNDLQIGDMIDFKPRSIIPPDLHGVTLIVKSINTYQYAERTVTEFMLATDTENISMCCAEYDDGEWVTIGKEVSRAQVLDLFNADDFALLFDPDEYANLQVNKVDETLDGWVADSYHQSKQSSNGYFYDHDRRSQGTSNFEGDSEEFMLIESEGSPDDYSISVEIWENGETDVYLEVSFPASHIENYWPSEQ
ncbi:hypothetical protein [Marinicella sp. W31]|uniref:hypothetical protein n=1 Tax=Marinicella sp. W31 TaxID=3023713 RepID=UPI0037576FC1